MDMYAMTLLGLMAAVLALTIIGTVQAVVSNRKAFNKVVAKNVAVKPPNRPLNYPDWKAKRDENHQRMKELNADFSAIISGE
jgi:cell division protein FtsN